MPIQPTLKKKDAVLYAGIRLRVQRDQLGQSVPIALEALSNFFTQHHLASTAPPLVRYFVVDYNDGSVDADVGFPVSSASIPAHPRIHLGQLPSGTYATLDHHGSYETLVKTTSSLLDWAKQTGTRWNVATENNVTWWAARVEHYIAGPEQDPSPENWLTEIAILLAD
ncbi:MAG TPA: GyrI-like domain-containing protein [Thermoanaerobaculia bacterium]|jgi:effector-binding domain-containing protein|nr:GyrI-like domain-containing protein [Thermoanaerobaculia bacterium]